MTSRDPFVGIPRLAPGEPVVYPLEDPYSFEEDLHSLTILLGLEEDPATGVLRAFDPDYGWVRIGAASDSESLVE